MAAAAMVLRLQTVVSREVDPFRMAVVTIGDLNANGTTFSGAYNGELVPDVRTLEHLNSYAPLPAAIAYNQFLARPGFRARQELFDNPGKNRDKLRQAPAGTSFNDRFSRVNTLPHKVFTRGKFKKGQSITFTHKKKVIPRNRQTDTYTSF